MSGITVAEMLDDLEVAVSEREEELGPWLSGYVTAVRTLIKREESAAVLPEPEPEPVPEVKPKTKPKAKPVLRKTS